MGPIAKEEWRIIMIDLIPEYSSTITLVAHDVDINNCWKISSVFGYVQDVANTHCYYLGCDWKTLMKNYDTCYVLTRMRLEMKQYPHSSDNVKITTWAENNKKPVFTRYFILEAEDGTNLGNAVSQWVLMNTKTRSIVRLSDCSIPEPDTGSYIPPVTLPKKCTFEEQPDSISKRVPVYSDFDYNGHVNNSRYIEWICDLFPPERYKENNIKTIDIRYIQEIRYGNTVTLELKDKKEESKFFVKGLDSSGKSYFEAYGEY